MAYTSSIELIAVGNEGACCIEHGCFLFGATCGEQDALLWDAVTYREHALEKGSGWFISETSHLTCRGHIDTEYGVGLLEAVERKLRGFDTHIIKVEETLVWLLYRQTEHYFSGKFNEIDLQYLANEWEGA